MSEDAVRALSARLPNVGVFLSTSAEGESFEWSEIQSGVFSHVVRSGLLGAADADGDGAVSYTELAAFVATETADVPNPNMRPLVFSRGPGARNDEALFATARSGARSFHLEGAGPMRIRLRDRNSLPLLDANEEAGSPLGFALPAEWTEGAVIERAVPGGSEGAPLESYAVPAATGELAFGALQPIAARGAIPAEIFQMLFTRPFGPHAVAAYMAEAKVAAAPVYDVSREDADRMQLLLGQIESAEHGQRVLAGAVALTEAAYFGAIGASAIAFDRSDPQTPRCSADAFGAVSAGLGTLSLAYGVYTFARPWSAERLAAEYRAALGTGDYAHAFAVATERMNALAAAERRGRWLRGAASGVVAAASAAAIVGTELSRPTLGERFATRAIGGAGVVLGITGSASALLIESPVERLTTMWRRDPSVIRIQPTLAPTLGGVTIGITGTF